MRKQIFTGGDNLIGIKKYYHLSLMQNEIMGGFGAYQLSFAQLGNSGLSFGGNQLDIAHNNKAAKIFMEIIQAATDHTGAFLFNNSDISHIALNIKIKGKPPEKIFTPQYLSQINIALSSKIGMTKINQAYVEEIDEKANFVTSFIPRIDNQFACEFYKTIFGQVLLFDYHNQYNISFDGTLEQYIDGNPIKTYINRELMISNSYTFEHHKNFIHSLKYANDGVTNLRDVNRRLNNIISILCRSLLGKEDNGVMASTCQCGSQTKNKKFANNCINLEALSLIV